MDREQIAQKVIAIAAEHADRKPETVAPESHFEHDLGYDSLMMVEFAMELEDAFKLSIPDDDMEQIRTVGQAVDAIAKLTDTRSEPTEP